MLKIKGFQTLTLLDYPGRLAATVFTGGCNFCCPFCHNASLVLGDASQEAFSEEMVLAHLKKRQGRLTGVCITGGEPLIHEELVDFIRRLKALGYAVKLDTNGTFPGRLNDLLQEGLLDYVAMDVKNCREKYALTAGLPDTESAKALIKAVEESVKLLRTGSVPFEFRTTIVKEFHSLEDVLGIGRWLAGSGSFFLQRFVDSGNIIASGLSACSEEEMERMRDALEPFIAGVSLRGL